MVFKVLSIVAWSQHTFSVKDQVVNNLVLAGHVVFVATSHLCSVTAAGTCANGQVWLCSQNTIYKTK